MCGGGKGEVDGGCGGLREPALLGHHALEQSLQAMGDGLHRRQVDGPGGALQAVRPPEDVVPIGHVLAVLAPEGGADRINVLAVLDLERRE